MKRLLVLVACLISLTLPVLIPHWHGKLLLFFFLLFVVVTLKSGTFKNSFTSSFFLLAVALIGVNLIGLFNTEDTASGYSQLETMLPLLLVALTINSGVFDNVALKKVFGCFVGGVILLNLASLAFISYDLWDPVNLRSNIILANNAIVRIHPVYLSLYISFCIFFLIDQFFPLETTNRAKTGWVLFSLVILVVYLIWINSRAGIFCFLIAAVFYILYKFRKMQRVVSFSVLIVIVALTFLVPFSRERFFTAPIAVLKGEGIEEDTNTATLWGRRQVLDCSLELLKGPEFFYGHGTGDFRHVLHDCYKSKGYAYAYEENLDSHNEYLAQLHRNGIVGFVVFVLLLIIPLRLALKYRNPLLAVFIILFAMTAMFENVFSAQKGVTFFALFCPLLLIYAKQEWMSRLTGTPSV